jgi:hypothetical protein
MTFYYICPQTKSINTQSKTKKNVFSEQDSKQIKQQGLNLELVEEQIQNFENGFAYAPILRAATIGDGILKIENEKLNFYIEKFEAASSTKKISLFVPASGAATRMFKALFTFMNEAKTSKEVEVFFENIEDFAFYDELKSVFEKNEGNFENALKNKDFQLILVYLLTEKGLNYGHLPKALLLFHQYQNEKRNPLEEYFVEAANYLGQKDKYIHFTVSEAHKAAFEQQVEKLKSKYEEKYSVKYHITFSQQNPNTDTIAVNLENKPFRNEDNSLLFRPAGHGALLQNLNQLDADIVFIKNIDNVSLDKLKVDTTTYKKVLAGILLDFETKIAACEFVLMNNPAQEELEIVNTFLHEELNISISNTELSKDFLLSKLQRPLRICGMVKNEGAAGGGPFWVQNSDGTTSLQIVESAQIAPEKQHILENGTHFNPVDLVCSLKNSQGNSYNLMQFRDLKMGFISQKSKDGKALKAQELPGLWNAAMADWNTIFVEVPSSTFNPVKTVNDLLKKAHFQA